MASNDSPKEHLWYSAVIEAVFLKGLGSRCTPEVKRAVREYGIDLDKLLPAYPVDATVNAMKASLPLLFPGVPADVAMKQLGAASMRGYNETMIGRAAVALLKLLGVRRALEKLHHSMSSGNNYLKTTFAVVDTTVADLTLSDVSMVPAFYEGLFEEGGAMLGAKNFRVVKLTRHAPGATYRVQWDA